VHKKEKRFDLISIHDDDDDDTGKSTQSESPPKDNIGMQTADRAIPSLQPLPDSLELVQQGSQIE
jgi:hypothetical protein